MGFFDTLFQQATPAPVQERMMQPIPPGVPQSPAVQPPPGVQPQPQQYTPPTGGLQQFPQGQPGSTPTPVVDQRRVNQWSALMDRIVQPDVLGPLQTFLAAASAPLEPGESLGARLGYAGTLMNLHKSMLEENARLAPYLQKERDLKIQQMETEISQKNAAARSSDAQARRAEQQMSQEWEAFPGEQEGKRLNRERTQQEIETARQAAEYDKKYKGRKAEAEIANKEEHTRYLKRLPQVPGTGAGGKEKLSKSQLEANYEVEIWAPYVEWAKTLDKGADTSFNAYLKENPTAAALYKAWSKQYKEAGGVLATRRESLGPTKGKGGKIDAQGNYIPNK